MRILTILLATSLLSNAQGIITTVAGKGNTLNPDGGPASSALLGKTNGVALDSAGNLYIGETYKGLRKVNTQGIISTLGSGIGPFGVAVDTSGNIYVADNGGNLVWKVTPSGATSIFAGTRTSGFAGDGGPANKAWLNVPYGVAVDRSGNVFIADSENNRIRKVDPKGTILHDRGHGQPRLFRRLCLSQIVSAAGALTCKPNARPRYSAEANGQAPEIHCGMGNHEQDFACARQPESAPIQHTNRGQDCYVQTARRS